MMSSAFHLSSVTSRVSGAKIKRIKASRSLAGTLLRAMMISSVSILSSLTSRVSGNVIKRTKSSRSLAGTLIRAMMISSVSILSFLNSRVSVEMMIRTKSSRSATGTSLSASMIYLSFHVKSAINSSANFFNSFSVILFPLVFQKNYNYFLERITNILYFAIYKF